LNERENGNRKHKEAGKEKEKEKMQLERFRVPKRKMHHQGEVAPDKQLAKKKE